MNENIALSQMDIDQLKEITNIGAGNAATALSTMTGCRVDMSVPESFVGGVEVVTRKLGNLSDKVVAVYFKVHGDIEGAMIMILPPVSAIALTELMTKDKITDLSELKPDQLFAVQEMGNILLGASITALNKFLNINMIHSIPDAAVDMLGSVMDQVLIETGDTKGDILAFKVTIGMEHTETKVDLYYLFDPVSSAKVLQETQKKMQ